MEKIEICNFLCLKSMEEQKKTMKSWLGLFIAFTIVFMDIGWFFFKLCVKSKVRYKKAK